MENQIVEEISLKELIEILIKRKKLIVIITVTAIFISALLSFVILKPIYEAETIIMISNINDDVSKNSLNNVEDMLDTLSKYPTMNTETFKQQIKIPAIIGKTIEDLNLEDEYTIDSLAEKITIETVNNTNLIKIKMTNEDPEKAASIVNKISENFIQVISKNIKDRITLSSEYIKTQIEREKKYYDEALKEQKELLSQPKSASELSLELNGKLVKITEYKNQLYDLYIRKSALESAINTSETVPSKGSSIVLNKQTGNIIIDDSTKILRIELAEVESTIEKTNEVIKSLQKEIEELQVELQEKKQLEEIVNQKVELAKQSYESFVKKYEELRVTESVEIGKNSITVISEAYPPSKPIKPNKAINLAVGTVLGLMAGVFAALFIEYWVATDTKRGKYSEQV